MVFDKHGNFFRQCKEPSRFGFYRVAADTVEHVIEVLKNLIKDPTGNKALLEPHCVDTVKYEQAAKVEQAPAPQEKQPESQPKQGYQPIDESRINWQEIEDKYGVKRSDLEASVDLTKMLNYGKSDLMTGLPLL